MKQSLLIFIIGLNFFSRILNASENFKVTTTDGFVLTGNFFPPQKGKITWILLHGLDSSHQEFQQLSEELSRQGYGVLSYDARGHGKSQRQNNIVRHWRSFGNPGPNSNWEKMIGDLRTIVKKLRKNPATNRIGLIGASLGANVALNYAASDSEVIATALLSPGLNYWGIEILDSWKKYGNRPVLIAASPGDNFANETVKFLSITNPPKKELTILTGKNAEHGQQMLHNNFLEKFLNWIEKVNKK